MKITRAIAVSFLFLSFISLAEKQTDDDIKNLNRLYFRLAGKSLPIRHPNRSAWLEKLSSGKMLDVAREITKEESFTNQVIRLWAIHYLSAGKSASMQLNDALGTIIGVVRDDMDARELLTGNFVYGPDLRVGFGRPVPNTNDGYISMETRLLSLVSFLKIFKPQWEVKDFKESAGLLTSRWWGETYYQGGTNRRSVKGMMETFLCQPIESWKTSALSIARIRQDVPRDPSDDPRVFQQECRSCHAPMDALAGAFAYFDFESEAIVYNKDVSKKYFHNDYVYPEGYRTVDDSWKNLLGVRKDLGIEWPSRMSGKGVNELGKMVVESEGFARCLSKRVVNHFCGQQLNMTDPWVTELAQKFSTEDKYKIKELILKVVSSQNCQ